MVRKVAERVFSVGAIDWDRRLFDELIPLPDGTSYNSYLLMGKDKVALLDTVDPSKEAELFANLEELGVDRIDYVIAHHAEQDHSGALPAVLRRYPMAKVVTNAKCKEFLMDLLPELEEGQFMVIEDGSRLPLGGLTLQFVFTPWVHWPETMSSYLEEEGILFSCDFFGSHTATTDLFVKDECKVLADAKRYYAEIMMPFRLQIRRNLEKLADYNIRMIAPSHGPVYDRPELILSAYREWISDEVEKKAVVAYVSMHGSSSRVVDVVVDRFAEKGISVSRVNLTVADLGELAMELVDAGALVLVGPYVLAGVHPTLMYTAYLVNALRPKVKAFGVILSYGWGGLGAKQLSSVTSSLRPEVRMELLIKGHPKDKDVSEIKAFVDSLISVLA